MMNRNSLIPGDMQLKDENAKLNELAAGLSLDILWTKDKVEKLGFYTAITNNADEDTLRHLIAELVLKTMLSIRELL